MQSDTICCNGADALNYQFDLVICNLPYLNTDEILDVGTDGGKEGLVVPMKIINSIKSRIKLGGELIFVTSSLSNFKELIEIYQTTGFSCQYYRKKKIIF